MGFHVSKVSPLIIQERVFLACAGIFIASLVAGNLIFKKFFTWSPFDFYTFNISVGILPYPVTFLITDIVSEIYGKKRADQIVISGFIASIFVVILVLIADALPAYEESPITSDTFNEVFGLAAPAVFASMTAYLTAQFIDIRLFHFWKRLTKGKHLWLRNNASTIVSQFVDSFCVIFLLCAAGAIEWSMFYPLVENSFLFKLLVALFDTPLFYIANYYLRKLMGLERNEEISVQQTLA